MKETIPTFILVTEEIIKTTRATIQPFTERPGTERELQNCTEDSIDASDLFSMFTANIIRQKVTFTR